MRNLIYTLIVSFGLLYSVLTLADETASSNQSQTMQTEYESLKKQLQVLEEKNKSLTQTFTDNKVKLNEQADELANKAGDLTQISSLAKKAAKSTKESYQTSFLGKKGQQKNQRLTDIIESKQILSLKSLQALWDAMQYQAVASGQISLTSASYIDGNGKEKQQQAIRLGDFGMVNEQGFVKWDFAHQRAENYLVVPKSSPNIHSDFKKPILIDPTRGVLLEQFANKPSLNQRIEQAGVVGKIILALLFIGLGIAIVRGIILVRIQRQIKGQLKRPQEPMDNPLGRILAVYRKEKNQSVNSLELRLLEAILDEQQGLEKGLSMLKLLAALAPMLGLLGTVTGMIETFQVITEFGNGDPKVMAGGISMALTTTVLGLVAAMPLLLAHNLLSNRAEAIRGILEKQGVSLVARQAEQNDLNLPNNQASQQQALQQEVM